MKAVKLSLSQWVKISVVMVALWGVIAGHAFVPDETLEDVKGRPAEVAMKRGQRQARRSQTRYNRTSTQRRQNKTAHRNANRARVARAPKQTRVARAPQTSKPAAKPPAKPPVKPAAKPAAKPPVKPAPKPPVKPATKPPAKPTTPVRKPPQPVPPQPVAPQPEPQPEPEPEPEPVIVEVPRQNLTVAFVNPRQQPVAGLRVIAQVQPQEGEAQTITAETDVQGHIKLAEIPLPAAVDLDFAASTAEAASTVEIADEEWDFADVEASSLLVLEPQGQPVTTRMVRAPGVRLASLRLPHGLAAAPESRRREIVYDDATPRTVVIERNVIDLDIAAPAGSTVTTAALPGQIQQVPESGHLLSRLPLAALQDGPVPVRVTTMLPAGEAEAVIDVYPLDPYQTNAAPNPDLRLVRLTALKVPGDLGVLDSRAEVIRAFGNLADKKNKALGRVAPLADGSEWWIYPQRGAAFKIRPSPFVTDKKAQLNAAVVERIRIFSPAGGSVGGLAVGSDEADIERTLGRPENADARRGLVRDVADAASPAGTVVTYLDRGLRVCHAGGKVLWMDLLRPTALLQAGTTAFVPRQPARLFVAGFDGHPRTGLTTVDSLRQYLRQINAVTLTDSQEDADLILDARTDFTEDTDKATSLIPFRYDCVVQLAYSLFDPQDNRYLMRNKEVSGAAKADYTKETVAGGVLGGVLLKKGGTLGRILGGAVIGGGIVELHKAMQKAANRAPAIATRTAFNALAGDISRAADFTVRVTGIDYESNRLWLNAGGEQGLRPGNEFQISVGNQPLPYEESSRDADFYTAVVLAVERDSALCELRHVERHVKKFKENFEVRPDAEMLRRLPDPATGVVAARAWLNFPDVTIISDEDVDKALAAAPQE